LKGGRYTVLYDWNTYKVKEIYTTGMWNFWDPDL
jgi:hypothetical protein